MLLANAYYASLQMPSLQQRQEVRVGDEAVRHLRSGARRVVGELQPVVYLDLRGEKAKMRRTSLLLPGVDVTKLFLSPYLRSVEVTVL